MSTSDMYKNMPAMATNTHRLMAPMLPTAIPITMPIQLSTDDKQLNKIARLVLTPFFSNKAKSPENVRKGMSVEIGIPL